MASIKKVTKLKACQIFFALKVRRLLGPQMAIKNRSTLVISIINYPIQWESKNKIK